ncbi:MAG TPA: 8-amino-7-oxononanoate synthase [Solirubrobacteraceae bacterium]|nr:8-amino-7-oxononanoate synthase [Solirubrobacteraceae bacterium]
MSEIRQRLEELERLGLGRRLRLISGPQGPTVLLEGRPVLLLCSNNYLGLADHPDVRSAAADAAMRWGVGAGASRLVSGTMTIHGRLEERLAAFEASDSCVLFGSGYLANLGAIGALAGRGGRIFSDELNHASIIDACRLAHADVHVYRHRDLDHLERSLQRHPPRRDAGAGYLIVTDSLFSMDGDVAPLEGIVELAQRFGARVLVDEAHALGSLGPGGRGAVAEAGLEDEVDVRIGTLGKALGSYGAYACADADVVRLMINTARSLIFSTAPGPPALAGALAALELLEREPQRVRRLRENAAALRDELELEGFPVPAGEVQIVPLVVGEERNAMALCQAALERGVFAQAIRPPTVPAGTARLRLAVMATHGTEELRAAARTLGDCARALGLDPARMGPLHEERAELAPWEAPAASHSRAASRSRAASASPAASQPAPSGSPTGSPAPFDFERAA